MTILSNPKVSVNIVPATTEVSNEPQQMLIVGQMLGAGSAVAGELQENIQNDNSWDGLFGPHAQVAGEIRDAKTINEVTRMDAIGLDDAGTGVDAAGNITFTGTATAAGSLTAAVGSKINHEYVVPVAIGDTAEDIGDALVALLAADDNVPVSAVNTTGDVDFTALNAGLIGNSIGLSISGEVAGITYTLTGFTGGTTDPTLTNVLDVIGSKRYQTIVWPWSDVSVVVAYLDARFNVANKILDGAAITHQIDTFSNSEATLAALNSKSLFYGIDVPNEVTNKIDAPAMFELNYSVAAQAGAIRALRRTEGANIGQYVITRSGALDSFGGPAISSKPMFNTPMPYLPVIGTGKGLSDSQVSDIVDAGGFVLGNNIAANTIIFGEFVTTYKTDSGGNPDVTFKYGNYLDTASSGREYFYNNLRSQYAQSRLTEGDLVEGRDMANANSIAAFCTKLYSDLSSSDYVLTQAGEAALNFYNENLSVTIDLATGTATVLMSVPIVTQLREIIVTYKIEFSVGS